MVKLRSLATIPLDGGTLAFHFINTVYAWRKENLHEYLSSYADVLTWCTKVGALSPASIRNLQNEAVRHPLAARKAYDKLIEARRILYEFFSAVAEVSPNNFLSAFNKLVTETYAHYEWSQKKNSYGYDLQHTNDLLLPLWSVVHDAQQVMAQQNETGRIKECSKCGWIFLDSTKNNQRRWCNPSTCGSEDKLKRYYQKNKA